jgi:beta-barrel assembly-enhancing protease
MLLGWDIEDLPANATIEQQIEAGNKQVAAYKEEDLSLDQDRELCEYFGDIEAKLIKNYDKQPPYPIVVHVSTEPIVNAFAAPGGQMLVYGSIFDRVGTESELVAIIAHETAHEYNDDFMKFWRAYKEGKLVYGKTGVLEESRAFEARADEDGARMMYAAGWDPRGMVAMLNRFNAMGVIERHGAPTFYSTHPRDPERIKAITDLIATFPPKTGLIEDSSRFRELKEKF